jgi:hypothetical protein
MIIPMVLACLFGVVWSSLRTSYFLRWLTSKGDDAILAQPNVCNEKGLLLSFVYKFGRVARQCC